MEDKFDNLNKLKDSELEDLIKNYSLNDENKNDYDDDKDKKKEIKKDNFAKQLSYATGFIYTLISPVVLLLIIYYVLTRYCFHKKMPILLIVLIILGIVTGYWALFKEFDNNKK